TALTARMRGLAGDSSAAGSVPGKPADSEAKSLRAGGQGSGIQEALRLYGRAAYRFSRPVQLVMTVSGLCRFDSSPMSIATVTSLLRRSVTDPEPELNLPRLVEQVRRARRLQVRTREVVRRVTRRVLDVEHVEDVHHALEREALHLERLGEAQ